MSKANASNAVRFLKHSVKKGELSARVYYSTGRIYVRDDSGRVTNETEAVVTLYAKSYGDDLFSIFPELAQNGSDLMSDYHEKDRVHIKPTHPLYQAALAAAH